MLKSKRSRAFGIALLSILALSFAAYGAIRYLTTVSNQVTITTYGVDLIRYDTKAQVTSIPWGTLTPPGSIGSDAIYGSSKGELQVKNTGDFPCWVCWTTSGTLPPGFTLTAGYTLDGVNSNVWTENTMFLGQGDAYPGFSAIPVGGLSDRIYFALSADTTVTRGTYNFTITLYAVDSATG